MPTYEYVCQKCDHAFEKYQPITDSALTVCPKEICKLKKWGKGKVKKSISAGAGLIFKGSGFYITDYRSENYKESAKKENASTAPKEGAATPAKEGAKAETKSGGAETKPAAKPVAPPAAARSKKDSGD